MVELLAEYGLFLAEAVTVVIAILIVFGGVASSSMNRRQDDHGHVKVTHLNETFEDMADVLKVAVLTKDQLKDEEKAEKKKEKEEKKAAKKNKSDTDEKSDKKRVFVLDFDGDMQAGGVEALG
ncbi:MAG: protease SohB, partial [Pseudomonadales bacterium]|nr:protease SohB [Pseudomonadales bacterium]